MAFRQIYNMYEVTNTSSIRSIVIITKNTQFLAHANSRLRDIRHQVVWNAIRILTYQTTLVSVNRIEITKQHHIPTQDQTSARPSAPAPPVKKNIHISNYI